MSINRVCRNYFHGFQDLSPKNSAKKNILGALKVLSYLTVIVPMGFGIAYGLSGRVKKDNSNPGSKPNRTTEIGKNRLSTGIAKVPTQPYPDEKTNSTNTSAQVPNPQQLDTPPQNVEKPAQTDEELLNDSAKNPQPEIANLQPDVVIEEPREKSADTVYADAQKLYGEKKYAEALDAYVTAGDMGNLEGFSRAAEMHYHGTGIKLDYSKAKQLFLKNLDSKNPETCLSLGYFYKEGLAGERNLDKAISYFEKAAVNNNPNALSELADIHLFRAFRSNLVLDEALLKKALEIHFKAAEKGSNRSLGVMHDFGYKSYRADQKMSVVYHQTAAEQGNTYSQAELGDIYHMHKPEAWGLSHDFNQAMHFHTLAANRNHPHSLNFLGDVYQNGWGGIERDSQKAHEFLNHAAELGNIKAQLNLADLSGAYYEDIDKLKYLTMAAECGHHAALFSIGRMYEVGSNKFAKQNQRVNKNLEKAIEFYEKAKAKGDQNATARLEKLRQPAVSANPAATQKDNPSPVAAVTSTGDNEGKALIAKGNEHFVKNEFKEAFDCYIKAVELGENDPEVLMKLGFAHKTDKHGMKDINKSIKYFEQAASLNHKTSRSARYQLALIYRAGAENVQKDIPKAIKYLEENGDHTNSKGLLRRINAEEAEAAKSKQIDNPAS